MKLLTLFSTLAICASIFIPENFAQPTSGSSTPLRPKGALFADDSFFPIAVWLQNPKNADRFKAAGINLYVGLWRGPNAEQLAILQSAGMHVICSQNQFTLENLDNPIFAAWMHGDEPDNAQALPEGKGWGPPIAPSKIQSDYEKIRSRDPSRSVFLNLGQGVAWDNWIGRGVRRNHPEDYPDYIKGGDIVSFDIYPVVHDNPEVSGKLEFVARGVERLRDWSAGKKVVWNCIEASRIDNPEKKASPAKIRAEVWMSLIHGSQGLIYFIHQFKPTFSEASMLEDPVTLEGVTKINAQLKELAPVLNSATISSNQSGFSVRLESPDSARIATMVKRYKGDTYLFTVGMENKSSTATFKFTNLPAKSSAEVLGESRTIPLKEGQFQEKFAPYEVHLYRISTAK